MARISAGLLMYRVTDEPEFFLVHPGGPFFAKKDEGAWSIPKGEPEQGEDFKDAAIREFEEEVGIEADKQLINLRDVVQKGGKKVYAWAFEGDLPENFILNSNTFEMEWPPRTGQRKKFPEIDRAEFFKMKDALQKINQAQRDFIYRLSEILSR